MDNICHTLVGAAFARAGIAAPVRLGAVTSMIAANLPDVDVLVFATDVPSVAFRRGWTHGVLAQATLPALLAGMIFLLTRSRRPSSGGDSGAALGPLLVLSYAGVLSHVFLDYLNNYGVRLLMPFSGQWFYGDTLFIVDPWLWIIFAAAVLLGRGARVHRTRQCIVLAGVYILCMMVSARAARAAVLHEWHRTQAAAPQALMVGPAPIDPFRKTIIIDNGDHYRTGTFTWLPRRTAFSDAVVRKNADDPAAAVARANPRVEGILVWARFPFWEITRGTEGTRVTVRDMRFAGFGRGGFSASVVVFPPSSISFRFSDRPWCF
jgi:inner membrane protein